MKKISTVRVNGNMIFKEHKLTIGLDLGDRWSCYCVLDEAGKIILEQKVGTRRRGIIGRRVAELLTSVTGLRFYARPDRRSWAEKAGLGFKLPKALKAIKRGKAA